jgi:hypothetical protein
VCWDLWRAPLSAEWVLDFLQIQFIKPTRYRALRMTPDDLGVNGAGAVAGVGTPSTTAVVISFGNDYAGGIYQGRNFIAGVAPSFISNSKLTGLGKTNFELLGQALKQQITTVAPVAGYNRTIDKVNYANTSSHNVSTYSVDDVLRVQRRREVGRGE